MLIKDLKYRYIEKEQEKCKNNNFSDIDKLEKDCKQAVEGLYFFLLTPQ